MSVNPNLYKEAMHMLKKTSRTFYIPITFLKAKLKRSVASAYLCMRAIDEIEDHETMDRNTKHKLLQDISELLTKSFDKEAYVRLIEPYTHILPSVTKRLADWIELCPEEIVMKVQTSTGEMAQGMAKWANKNWLIHTKEDLDDYTYYVAGLVGCMLSDLWKWHDKIETKQHLAIAFGRGLQAVNILRNRDEDQERGVTFFPDGWSRSDMFQYAETNLLMADQYIKDIQNRRILLFCKIPLSLAHGTLTALAKGNEKITRDEVNQIVERVKDEVK